MSPRRSKEKSSDSGAVRDGQPPFRSDFGERLRFLLDQFDTRVEAGEIADITPEHLASYIAGRASPRFEAIARLAGAKNVSLDWLATGAGARFTGEAESDGFVAITVLADTGARFDDGEAAADEVLFSRAWLRATIRVPDAALRLVIHRGNSNAPVIQDGDAMLVDTTMRVIIDDGLYVFPRDGKFQAKFVETFVDGRVALKSRNPDYGMQTLSAEEAGKLPVIGRVRWRSGLV